METLNLQQLQTSARRGVHDLLTTLSALSPIMLTLAMIALFAVLGYFQFVHFSSAMRAPFMAATAAALYQVIRFGTALASIRLFSASAHFRGTLSLGASLVLTILEYGMVSETAAAISTDAPGADIANTWLIGVFTWLSFALELFVAVTLPAMFADAPRAHTNDVGTHTQNGVAKNANGQRAVVA